MCKTKLMSRWVNILTGVAICALVGVFAVSDSWAAMCMVGYDKSKCDSKSPSASPSPKPCTGSNCCTGANCDSIPVDCERLGYKLYAAKPNDSSIWPSKALKNGQNDTANWQCDACMKGNDIVWEKNYVRYNCYQLCKDPASATNIKGGTGTISNWFSNTEEEFPGEGGVITRKVNSRFDSSRRADSTNSRHVYREQFVLTSDDCKVVAGTKEVNGRVVEKKKFEWVTRYICGKCDRLCDGATITAGCYKPCQNPYTLEDGTRCCNETTLELMNKNNQLLTEENKVGNNLTYVIGGDTAWHTPRYAQVPANNGGCYEITEEQEAADGTICYKEKPKECGLCTKPDSACACVAKTCADFAAEKGYEYGEAASKVIDLTGRSLYNGNVKIGGVCYVPDIINEDCYGEQTSNDGTNTTVPKCARLEKLVCPDGGNGDDECSCGIGCPSGYAQMEKSGEAGYSSTLASNYSINLEPYKVGNENKKSCVKLADDGHTCAPGYEVQCYKWIGCSDVAAFLTADGYGGCECDRSSGFYPVGESTDCPIPEATSLGACTITANGNAQSCKNTSYSTRDGDEITKHDQTTKLGKITCHFEPSVVCDYSYQADKYFRTLEGPYSCQCRCQSDYYSDTDPIPACAICQRGSCDPTAKEDFAVDAEVASGIAGNGWIGTDNVAHAFGCYKYEEVNCQAADYDLEDDGSCGCKCPSGSTNEADTPKPAGDLYTYVVDTSYRGKDGQYHDIKCWKELSCDYGEVKAMVNGQLQCITCSKMGYSGTGQKNVGDSCEMCGSNATVIVNEVETFKDADGNAVLYCYNCGGNAPAGDKSCEDLGYVDGSQSSNFEIDGNGLWCCSEGSGSMTTSVDTDQPDGNGGCLSCYQCTDSHKKANNCPSKSIEGGTAVSEIDIKGYADNCTGTARCTFACKEYRACDSGGDCYSTMLSQPNLSYLNSAYDASAAQVCKGFGGCKDYYYIKYDGVYYGNMDSQGILSYGPESAGLDPTEFVKTSTCQ